MGLFFGWLVVTIATSVGLYGLVQWLGWMLNLDLYATALMTAASCVIAAAPGGVIAALHWMDQ